MNIIFKVSKNLQSNSMPELNEVYQKLSSKSGDILQNQTKSTIL